MEEDNYNKQLLHAKRLFDARDYLEAANIYNNLISIYPEYYTLHCDVASCYINTCNQNDNMTYLYTAEEHLNKAITLNPNYGDSYYLYAIIGHYRYNNALRYDNNIVRNATMEYIEKALEINPKNPEYHHTYSLILDTNGQKKQAEKELYTALELDPNYIEGLMTLACNNFDNNKYKLAQTFVDKIFKIDPVNLKNHYLAARISLINRDIKMANWHADAMTNIDPNSEMTNEILATIDVCKNPFVGFCYFIRTKLDYLYFPIQLLLILISFSFVSKYINLSINYIDNFFFNTREEYYFPGILVMMFPSYFVLFIHSIIEKRVKKRKQQNEFRFSKNF
ncbi:MAG: tetratricopeptide repeat protein [Pseudomonadota bacterium]